MTFTEAQADGLACVMCDADYMTTRVPHQPVGRSDTGSQIFACSAGCAEAFDILDTLIPEAGPTD